MTAAATPNTPSRADWAWPSKSPPPPAANHFMAAPSSPLELQFLPPSAAAMAMAAASADLPAAAPTPWTVDPSRLQKLMMGSLSTPPDRLPLASNHHDCVSDFGPFFDPAVSKPLPSGWERCLDLKSGEVFIKKSDAIASKSGIAQRLGASQTIDASQVSWRTTRSCDAAVQTDDRRADWTPSCALGRSGFPPLISQSKGMSASRKVNAKAYGEEQQSSSPDRPSLCLDLDLRLSDSRSRLAGEAPEVLSPPSLRAALSSAMKSRDSSGFSSLQIWNRQPAANVNKKPASIQEMVSESTMATAVCSKCLMYVLLKKSNPTCPRCFNPIILNCGAQTTSVNKRARLDLSPEDLSLSTDSSSR